MIRFTVRTEIARPPREVFAYVTDPTHLPNWQTNTVSVEVVDGAGEPAAEVSPLVVGRRLREVHRGPGGRELTSLVEVAELERDRVFALRMLDGPLPLDARITFAPTRSGGGTLLDFTVSGAPRGPMRLAQPLLRPALRRQFERHCATLKRVLEQRGDR